MFGSKFIATPVGQAASASLVAMIAFVVMSMQMAPAPASPQVAVARTVEIA